MAGKRLCVGMLAHVDSGKTTLSEAMLYRAGAVRRLGRVDHGDAFLDTEEQERERGITIFSKQARLTWKDCRFTLLDTPGHVDFSAETERAVQVMDCAVLLISGSDGVQGHTRTLWKLLERHRVPTFLFVNKMDQPDTDRAALLAQLRARLSDGCADLFGPREELLEQAALCDEDLMERYLETGELDDADLSALIVERKLFPCLFGAALRLEGVDELLDGLARFALEPDWRSEFAARVFKISRDDRGERLTWLKVTGGTLRVRDAVRGPDWEEKATQLRLYSGARFTPADEVPAGTVCAVTGLTRTRVGSQTGLTDHPIAAGGLVGTPSNSNLPTDVEQDPTGDDYTGRIEGSYQIEYMNPATQTHTVRTAGYITDCTISVSINSNAVQGGVVNTDQVVRHAANAAGITGIATEEMTAQEYLNGKISVMAEPFYNPDVPVGPDGPDTPGFWQTYMWVIIAAGAGLVLFAIVLTVILLLRKKKRKKQEEEQKAIDELMAVAMPEEVLEEPELDENGNPVNGADVMDLHTERSMELRQSIRDFVDENMEVAALLIRGWLKGEDSDG